MADRRVMVAMPSYDGRLDVDTLFTITDLQGACLQRGWGFGLTTSTATAPISVARSLMCQDFLRSDATDLFFIDADIACDRRSMIRMIEHPVDLVLGIYPERHPGRTYTLLGLDDGTHLERDPKHGLVEIQGAGCGFMRIRRVVLELMNAAYDEADDYYVPNMDIHVRMLFKTIIGKELTCSEDINFCLTWRKLGGQVWFDPDLTISHSGRASFSANFWKDFAVPNGLVTA